MGVAAAQQGRLDEAADRHRDALAAYEAVGSVEGAAFTYACLGFLATRKGDTEPAMELCRSSLAKAALGHERRATALAVEGLAAAHALAGDAQAAACLLGVASQLRGVGETTVPWMSSELTRVETSCRSLLGDATYDAAHASGRQQADTIVTRLLSGEQPLAG